MKNIVANISFAPVGLPDGVTAGALRVSIAKADGSIAVDAQGAAVSSIVADAAPYVFPPLPSGQYVVTVQRLDSAGNPLGSPCVSAPQDVVQPTYDAPVAVTVTLG